MLFSRRGAEALRKAKSFTLQGSFFPLRLCASARYIFYSSPARLVHPVKATKCLFSRRGAGTLRKAKSFTLQGSFFPLRPCASARECSCSFSSLIRFVGWNQTSQFGDDLLPIPALSSIAQCFQCQILVTSRKRIVHSSNKDLLVRGRIRPWQS